MFTIVLTSGSESDEPPTKPGCELTLEAEFKNMKKVKGFKKKVKGFKRGCRCERAYSQICVEWEKIREERHRIELAYEKIRNRERAMKEAIEAVNVIIENTN